MKKVLYVIDTLNSSGAEKSLVEIAQHLKEYTPVFVHIYKGEQLKPILEEAGISVYSLNIPGPRNFSWAMRELTKVYEKEKPDVVHSTLFRSDAITRKLRSQFDIPLISSFVNNSYNKRRFDREPLSMKIKVKLVQLYDAITSRKVDYFISNSETIKTSKTESMKIDLDKVKVIYRGRNQEKFEGVEKRKDLEQLKRSLGVENQNILLNVSRLRESKGQLDIINAMPAILEKYGNTVLLIAGHGDYREKLAKRITELNLENNVKLLGRRSDIPELLAIADIFLYPSYLEGLPGALIEAMLAEKIIICSDIPENMECVDQNSALIYEAANIEDLTSNILKVLDKKDQFQNLGRNAKETAIEKFDINKVALTYEKTYGEVINSV